MNKETVRDVYSELWVVHKLHHKYSESIYVLNYMSNS